MSTFLKDPDAVLDYSVDWSDWLDGDAITASQWIVPAGLTLDSSTNSTTATTAWLSGGAVRFRYTVTNRITTASGRVDDRSIVVQVVGR